MNRCGCNPVPEPFEFPIQNRPEVVVIDCPRKENLCELKKKIICEFLDVINKLECGIQPDLELLLEEISFVYIYDEE